MRLRGRQLDAINAALKNGTAEDFNAALQKTCAQAEGIGQFVPAQGSTSRLDDAIESAKRKAVDELNALDFHEGDLRKWNIIERAIRSVIAEMSNDGGER